MKKNLAILLMLGFTAMGAQAADRPLALSADVKPVPVETPSQEISTATPTVDEKKEVYFDVVEVENHEVDSRADGDIQNI